MVKRVTYAAEGGLQIVLEVPQPPMGDGSGFIPPPIIEFFRDGEQVPFRYWSET